MPKLSLSRRHKRQSNLALLTKECDEGNPNSLMSVSAPRKVSDDDIHRSSNSSSTAYVGAATTDLDCVPALSFSSSSSLSASSSSPRLSLKRPKHSICLVGLAGQAAAGSLSSSSYHHSSFAPQTPRPSSMNFQEQQNGNSNSDLLSPSSPWGHFVDMLIPSSSSSSTSSDEEDDFYYGSSGRFLPTCPRSYCINDPYPPLSQRKRRRIQSPLRQLNERNNNLETHLDGFVLRFPEPDRLLHDLAGLSVE